jgi:hypothetical protein
MEGLFGCPGCQLKLHGQGLGTCRHAAHAMPQGLLLQQRLYLLQHVSYVDQMLGKR